MFNQSQDQILELNNLFLKYFYEDNSFLKRIEAKSKSYYDVNNFGICAFATKGNVDIEIHSMSNECPGIIINCFEVSNIFLHFTLEFNPYVEQDSFSIRLYLHGKDFGAIECESLSYKILDESCWNNFQ